MRWFQFFLIVLIAALMAIIAGVSVSDAGSIKQDQCVSQQALLKRIKSKIPNSSVRKISGERAGAYIRRLNELPPTSKLTEPDLIVIVLHPAKPRSVFINGFRNDCRIGLLEIGKKLHQKVLRSVAGIGV